MELKKILEDAWEVLGLDSLQNAPKWEEVGETFAANACIKIQALQPIVDDPNTCLIADDSGLCVPFLKGAPGVYSARYAVSARERSFGIPCE